MKFQLALFLALVATASASVSTEEPPATDLPTTTEASTTTKNPGLPYGSVCNSLIATCNRYSNTVQCVQRRPDPTTTAAPTTEESNPQPTTETAENPLMSVFKKKVPAPQDVCETGIGAVLGRCQCSRNCKNGVYVDDGEFDEQREVCVGLVGSICSLFAPNCTKNGHCNFFAATCVCDTGFAADSERRCVAAE